MRHLPAKRLLLPCLGACLIVLATVGHAQKAEIAKDEIVQKAWTAMFGSLRNEDVKSLAVDTVSEKSTVPSRMTVLRPNRFRNEVSSGVLVFDGTRAAWVSRTPDPQGRPRGPELIEQASWKHFEVDIALLVPAFFDYPSEHQGMETVDGAATHKIVVRLPLGGQMTYFVDAATFRIRRRLVNWDGGAGASWENLMGPSLSYNGVFFPDGYRSRTQTGTARTEYRNVRINVNPPAEWFQIPKELNK